MAPSNSLQRSQPPAASSASRVSPAAGGAGGVYEYEVKDSRDVYAASATVTATRVTDGTAFAWDIQQDRPLVRTYVISANSARVAQVSTSYAINGDTETCRWDKPVVLLNLTGPSTWKVNSTCYQNWNDGTKHRVTFEGSFERVRTLRKPVRGEVEQVFEVSYSAVRTDDESTQRITATLQQTSDGVLVLLDERVAQTSLGASEVGLQQNRVFTLRS